MLKIFSSFALFAVLLSCGGQNSAGEAKPKNQVNVPAPYSKNCAKCHGDNGKLMVAGAKDLSISTLKADEVSAIIQAGKGAMPGYGTLLNENEQKEVTDFVMSLRK